MSEVAIPLYPEISGTEEEMRISISNDGHPLEPISKERSAAILQHIDPFCPTLPGSLEFRINGSRMYVDSHGNELATAECDTSELQAAQIDANAALLMQGIQARLRELGSITKQNMTAVVQRRVIDDQSNTWACHDSFSFWSPDYAEAVGNAKSPEAALLRAHLLSRNFMTGAGLVTSNGCYYSQKMTKTLVYYGYGYSPYMLRVDTEHGKRLEIRCNDVNILDWSKLVRIGIGKLMVAASQSPLLPQLLDREYAHFDRENHVYNRISFNEETNIRPTQNMRQSIDFQRFAITTILNRFERVTGQQLPPEAYQIGQMALSYADDMSKVIRGEASFDELLAGRSDWATKFNIIKESLTKRPVETKGRHAGRQRRLRDEKSKHIDRLYDRTSISYLHDPNAVAGSAGEPIVRHGFGQRLAERNRIIKEEVILDAMSRPPANTRAATRVQKTTESRGEIMHINWNSMSSRTWDGNTETKNFGGYIVGK